MDRRAFLAACLFVFSSTCLAQGRAVQIQPVGRALAAAPAAGNFGIKGSLQPAWTLELSAALPALSPFSRPLEAAGDQVAAAVPAIPVFQSDRPAAAALEAARESSSELSRRFADEVAPALESAAKSGASAETSYEAGRALGDFLVRARSSPGRDLAPALRLDPGMEAPIGDDLARLQGILQGVDLRKRDFYLGLPPELRSRQRDFFSWLKRQLDRGGDLPLFELTRHVDRYGEYLNWSGLALVHRDRNRRQAERLATLLHESYHRYASWRGLPHREGGREVQERDAAIAELLLWEAVRIQSQGRLLPDLKTANFLRLLREGRIAAIQDYVDRVYGEKDDTVGPQTARRKLLRLQLESRLERLRRLGGSLGPGSYPAMLLARRLNAIRRHILYLRVTNFDFGLGRLQSATENSVK